ncbi:MAG: PDZ domain-containing protein [Cyanobacteria bacterium]|nr:PDZ domain-containing protein [Cyanobacteriota bacterium]
MTRRILLALACVCTVVTSGVAVRAQALDPIRYTLRFPAPHTHYVEVEAAIPTAGRAEIEVYMATWTPGSYLIREYERHVEAVTASAGTRAVNVVKSTKNRWKITTGGAPNVTLRYKVYSREMTVRNNWVESAFAMLNGAPTFITLVERAARPHEVRVELPAAWKRVETALEPVSGSTNTFRAPDFDTIVDSPIIIGNPVTREFTVDGKKHTVVFEGDASLIDADRVAADVQKIVMAAKGVMGSLPYPHYHFMTMVTESSGALEHKNSYLGMTNRFATRTRNAYLGFLGTLSHEYFHNWNVKRLRPVELGPFDYENENYVKTLWVAEGFTDYYADILNKRAGIETKDEYLNALSNQIEQVQTIPGRLVTPVNMASFDTWIKQYRPDENLANISINYYPKGAVIAFLLDAKIRKATNGARSLDTGMQWAMQRYAGDKGYTPDQFYAVMSEAAGTDLKGWFAKTAESTDELEYTEALEYFGLRFHPVDMRNARAYIGGGTRNDAGRLIITSVRRGTPGIDAGLNVDDEIIAIDDVRVRADGLAARLDQYKPGDKIAVTVARRDRLMQIDVTLGPEPGRTWRLEALPNATAEQTAHLNALIEGK